MKKHFSLFIALVASSSIAFGQRTQLPIYEPFDYAVGNLGLSTATVAIPWNFGSSKSAKVVIGELNYSGLPAPTAKMIELVNSGGAANIKTLFTAVAQTDSLYASFLVKGLATPAFSSNRIASFQGTTNSTGTFTPSVFYDQSPAGNGFFRIGVDGMGGGGTGTGVTAPKGSDYQSRSYAIGTTVMVVMKHTPSTNTRGGITDFWINPKASGAAPDTTFAGVTGGIIGNIDGFTLRTGTGAAEVAFDELRIGSSWNDVAPGFQEPPTIPNVGTAIATQTMNALSIQNGVGKNSFYVGGEGQVITVEVFSVDGKKRHSLRVAAGQQFDLNNLATGIYILKATADKASTTTKVNIQ